MNPLLDWVTRAPSEHLVQFYPYDSALILPLLEFVSKGLRAGDTCRVVATQKHLLTLNEQLLENGIDVAAVCASGQYITLDATKVLELLMVGDLPSKRMFTKLVGGMIHKAQSRQKPIRIYGEMVALLWRDGNKKAVMKLEKYWNELAEQYDFSLYCAYPELHFIMNQQEMDEIHDCHNAKLLPA